MNTFNSYLLQCIGQHVCQLQNHEHFIQVLSFGACVWPHMFKVEERKFVFLAAVSSYEIIISPQLPFIKMTFNRMHAMQTV